MEDHDSKEMRTFTLLPDQKIHIGDDIVISTIRCSKGKRVPIVIHAPKEVLIYREELLKEIRK